MPTTLTPYLSFRDEARAAMDFYHSVFGGEVTYTTFAELMPDSPPEEQSKVMHAQLTTRGGMVLMAADTPNSWDYAPGGPHAVSLWGDDESELRGYFDGLSAGGTVSIALEKAPWGDHFGMCRDRFGIAWMVNIAG